MQRFDDPPGAERSSRRRLQHHGIAADQSRRQLPDGNRRGEIPGRNKTDDADRLTNREHVHPVPLGRDHHAGHARALSTEVARDVDGPAHLALCLRKSLAFFAGHLRAELVELAIQDVGGFIQQIPPRRRRQRRPGRKGRGRCVRRIGDVLGRALREQANHLIRVGRIAIFERLRASCPFAINVVLESLCAHGSPDSRKLLSGPRGTLDLS